MVPAVLWMAGVPREDVGSEDSPRFHGSIHPAVKMTEPSVFIEWPASVCGPNQDTRLRTREAVELGTPGSLPSEAVVRSGRSAFLGAYCWHWVMGEACSLLGQQASPALFYLPVARSPVPSRGISGQITGWIVH